jgi:hypothetical protein
MPDIPDIAPLDLDVPTDQSISQTLSKLPTWEEWLQQHGFRRIEKSETRTMPTGWNRLVEGGEWQRLWRDQGRGWEVTVRSETTTITIRVFSNPMRYGHSFAMINVAERSVVKAVEKLIAEIERPVSDATKKRRIMAYTSTIEWEDREDIPTGFGQVAPLRRLVGRQTEGVLKREALPDDPSPEQAVQALDRVQVRCFPKGQRVRVKGDSTPVYANHYLQRLAGKQGTVVDAGENSCYVALDDYVNAGDPDPFRFDDGDLEPIYERVDEPGPYVEALDYITPLLAIGYTQITKTQLIKRLPLGQGLLAITVDPAQSANAVAFIHVDFSAPAWVNLQTIHVSSVFDIVDTVRQIEQVVASSQGLDDFRAGLQEKGFKGPWFNAEVDDDDIDEALDFDAPESYLQELQWESDTINAFREQGVRMRRPKGGPTRPYYTMFWIPSAVTCCSYDLWLTPNADRSWSVEVEGYKTFYNADDPDWRWEEDFVIDREWSIPAGATGDELKQEVQNILADIRTYVGPAEPMKQEPDVDDIDEAQDTEACAACGGKCCKQYPGMTSPEDWGAPDQEQMRTRLRAALNSGDYEFDDWFGDPTKKSGGQFDVRMIRPTAQRRMGHKGEWDRCKLLKDTGCSLPYEQRPKECRGLVPDAFDKGCRGDYTKQQAAIDWMSYQDLLRNLEDSIIMGESKAFLESEGWQAGMKVFPVPRQYLMAGIVLAEVPIKLGLDPQQESFVQLSLGKLPIQSYRLPCQQVRLFASGIAEVLNTVAWPESKGAALRAGSLVEQAVGKFIRELRLEAQTNVDDPTSVL